MNLLITFPTLLVPVLAVCLIISFLGFFTTKNAYGKNTWFQRNHMLIAIVFLIAAVALFVWKMKY